MGAYAVGDEPVPGYQIIRPLGEGGYGKVWVARSPGDVEIALKIINLEGQGLKEFRAVGIVKRLRHPNLIPIYAFWLKDEYGNFLDSSAQDSVNLRGRRSELIIAMGLGEKSLAQRLEECKRAFAQRFKLPDIDRSLNDKLAHLQGSELAGIPIEELLDYMSGSARAIDYLNQPHALGAGPPAPIQHCDIKPANLVVVGNDVQVCDYGLARALTSDARKTQAAGTPAYMSPELIANQPSAGTDQYSLAITYYELRTGRLPFEESLAYQAHITGNLDFSLLGPGEQETLRRATHVRPDQRFPHTMDLIRALRESLSPSRPLTPVSAPSVIPSAPSGNPSNTPLPSSAQHAVFRSGSLPPGAIPAGSGSGPTLASRPTVLDDLIRAGYELVPGHTLVRLLGRGGYGEVWEARMPGNTRCALKIVRNLDAVQGKQEFRSLDLIRDLDHDRLIRLQAYWLLTYDGQVIPDEQIGQPGAPKSSGLVVATDLAAKNLMQRWQECLDEGKAGIDVHELVKYMQQSAEAIDYLNRQNPAILHRDIKPENILLTRNNQVKVSDFGLAKIVEGASQQIGSASVGMTLAYAAPEMFRNKVTLFTDQYSLAVTYYRLRVGRLPFEEGLGPIQMMQAHAEGRLDFSGIGEGEQIVLRKACAVDPDSRFSCCLEFVAALQSALNITPSGMSTPTGLPRISSTPSIGTTPQVFAQGGASSSQRTMPIPGLRPGADSAATERFAGVETPPSGWPAHPQSSGEFELPNEPRRPASLPPGVTETTSNIPAVAGRDTRPEPAQAPWRKSGRGPNKFIVGGASAFVVALIAGGIYYFVSGPSGKSTPTMAGGGGGAVGSNGVGGGGNVNVETVEQFQQRIAKRVAELVAARDFAGAANAVHESSAKAGQDWTKQQNQTIVAAWRNYAETKETDAEKIAEYKKLLAVYAGEGEATRRIAALQNKDLNNIFVAAIKSLRSGDFKDSRAKLASLRSELEKLEAKNPSEDDRKIFAVVRGQMDEVGHALDDLDKYADPSTSEKIVGNLQSEVARRKPMGEPEHVAAIREAYRMMLEKKIEQLARVLGERTSWKDLLVACKTAAPPDRSTPSNPWVDACRGECVTELLARRQLPPGEDRTLVTTPANADPALSAYSQYVGATRRWIENDSGSDRAAADQLAAMAPATGPSTAQNLSDFRCGRLFKYLTKAASHLKGNDPLAPFAGPSAADAVRWLSAANRLIARPSMSESKVTAPSDVLRGKLDLLFALLAQSPPAKNEARPLADELVKNDASETLKELQLDVPQRVLLWTSFARSRDDASASRLDAIRGYVNALKLVRSDLSQVPADYLYPAVIKPLMDDRGRQIVGAQPEPAVKAAAGGLYALAARNVRRNASEWSRVDELADEKDEKRTKLVVDLFKQAAALNPKGEFIAWQGIAMSERPKAEVSQFAPLAKAAEATGDDVPAVLALAGVVAVAQAEQDTDYKVRLKLWHSADKKFRRGIQLCQEKPDDWRDELVLMYQSAANNCIQIANRVTDRKEMSDQLDDAKNFADQLLKLEPDLKVLYDTRGCALEDMAWLRRDADRLGDTGKYAEAVKAFTEAVGGLGTRPTPWMHLGRCRFKWAEDEYQQAGGTRELDEGLLGDASGNLDQAIQRSSGSMVATESYFWKGKIALLRYLAADAAKKAALYAEAEAAFRDALPLARSLKAAAWAEVIQQQWAVAAFQEAQRLVYANLPDAARKPDVARALERASAKARDLSDVSDPWSAYLGMLVIQLEEAASKGENKYDEFITTSARGLKQNCRLQDRSIQFKIYMLRAEARLSTIRERPIDDVRAALTDDIAPAIKLAEDPSVGLNDDDLATAIGAAGRAHFRIYRIASRTDDREAERIKVLENCRRAIALSPQHSDSWWWKSFYAVARALPARQPSRPQELANQYADVIRNLREAEAYIENATISPPGSKKQLPDLVAFRRDQSALATPTLLDAIRQSGKSADAPTWHLALAEIYSLTGKESDKKLAQEQLTAALATLPRPEDLPVPESESIRMQVERIVKKIGAPS